MSQLPEASRKKSRQDHIDYHNELRRLHNILDGSTVPSTGGGGTGATPAGQLYAYQSGGGVVHLTSSGGATNVMVNVDTVDGSYDPDDGGLVEWDLSTHKLNVLADCAIQAFISPSWGNPGAGSGGKLKFEMHSNNGARFYWAYNFDLLFNPTIPTASGTPPIYPLMLFRAGDIIQFTANLYGGGITSIDVNYVDIAVTAVATS